MIPPFTITPLILRRVGQIERLIGRIEGLDQPKPQPHLRKTNRVRTVHGSLAIEGNTLDRAGQEFSKQKFSRPNGPTKRARQQSEAPPWVPRPQMTVPPPVRKVCISDRFQPR